MSRKYTCRLSIVVVYCCVMLSLTMFVPDL